MTPSGIDPETVRLVAQCGIEVYLHLFLTSTLDGCEWLTSRPGRFIPVPTIWDDGSGRYGEEQNLPISPALNHRVQLESSVHLQISQLYLKDYNT